MENKIYAIMACTKIEENITIKFPNVGVTNLVGFYMNKKTAFLAVRENWEDIWDACFDYVIIEEEKEGIFNTSTVRWFFKFNKDTKMYEEIPEPICCHNFCGLIMS